MGNSLINRYVFLPPDTTYSDSSPYQVTWLDSKSGKKIPSYFMESRVTTKTTIVYSHGNAADLGACFDFLYLLRSYLPVNVLGYEYLGYGLAKDQGGPNEASCYESIEAALKFLKEKKSILPQNVIVFGTSVGSGASCHIASKLPVKGLVLECPFMSCCRVVTQSVVAKPLDMFQNIDKIHKVRCPVTIFHGRSDQIVPFSHSVELWKRVSEPFRWKNFWIDNADHHDIIQRLSSKRYIEILNQFILYCEKFDPSICPSPSIESKPTSKSSSFLKKFECNPSANGEFVDFEIEDSD